MYSCTNVILVCNHVLMLSLMYVLSQIQEERQNRYDKENQILLNKIQTIVKGQGTINNWNQWSRKE